MADDARYLVVGLEKFHQDLHLLRRQANTSQAGPRPVPRIPGRSARSIGADRLAAASG